MCKSTGFKTCSHIAAEEEWYRLLWWPRKLTMSHHLEKTRDWRSPFSGWWGQELKPMMLLLNILLHRSKVSSAGQTVRHLRSLTSPKNRIWLWNSAAKHKEAFSWHVCRANGFEIELETCQIGTFAWGLLTTESAHTMLSCIDQQALEPIFTYKMAIQYQKQPQCIFSQLVREKQRLATVWQ